MDVYLDKIKEISKPILDSQDVVLVDLFLRRDKKKIILRFLIDKPEGGISLDECAKLNEIIGEALDKDALIQESFILEVSSPGLDRPLITIEDFSRVQGRDIRVFLREPVNEKIEIAGKLDSLKEDKIVIDTADKKIEIPIDKINKAKQIF